MIRHILDEADDRLLARWKGNGLSTYTVHVMDDEREVVFSHGSFELRVPAGMYGVPIFTQDERDLLSLFLDEYEMVPQAVKR